MKLQFEIVERKCYWTRLTLSERGARDVCTSWTHTHRIKTNGVEAPEAIPNIHRMFCRLNCADIS